MPKTLNDAELAELQEIITEVHYRLITFDGQSLAEAGPGHVIDYRPTQEGGNAFALDLTPERARMQRAKAILAAADDEAEAQAQKAAVHRGIAQGRTPE